MAVNKVINSYFPSLNNPVLSWSETFVPNVGVVHRIPKSQVYLVSLSSLAKEAR